MKMESNRLAKQIEFIKEIDKLKYIKRKTRLFNSDIHENVSEHSWHLAMMVMILSEHSNEKINIEKALKMVLIHDIVEIDAGDTFLFDSKKNHENTSEELLAAHRIFGILPEDQADECIALWEEFERGETDESKFARAMDRFEPVLQNVSNQGGTWVEYKVPYKTVIDKIKGIKLGSKRIWNYTESIVKTLNMTIF